MKDFQGVKLHMGDVVAFTAPGYRNLVKGKIIAFTPQQIRLEYVNSWNYKPGMTDTFLTHPTRVVKLNQMQFAVAINATPPDSNP